MPLRLDIAVALLGPFNFGKRGKTYSLLSGVACFADRPGDVHHEHDA